MTHAAGAADPLASLGRAGRVSRSFVIENNTP
jgi:hypothetical protein